MSIHKRVRKSGVKYQVKFRLENGQQIAKTFNNKKSAEIYEADLKGKKLKGVHIGYHDKTTFSECADLWLAIKRPVTEKTNARIHGIINKHLKPELGARKMSAIKYSDICLLVKKWELEGLKPRTITYHMRVLSPIFKLAVKNQIITNNPALDVALPKHGSVRRRPLTGLECSQLISNIDARFTCFVSISIACALRFSEAANLKIADIDFQNKTLKVGKGKTLNSERTLELTHFQIEMISKYLDETKRTKTEKSQLLFLGPNGGQIHYQNFMNRYFSKTCKQIGLDGITFHDLRRTTATALINSGVNQRVVMERMGHASSQITLDLYSAASKSNKQEAAEILSTYIQGVSN